MAHKGHWPSTGDWMRSPGTGCTNKGGFDESITSHTSVSKQGGHRKRADQTTKHTSIANKARLDGEMRGIKDKGGVLGHGRINGWMDG